MKVVFSWCLGSLVRSYEPLDHVDIAEEDIDEDADGNSDADAEDGSDHGH